MFPLFNNCPVSQLCILQPGYNSRTACYPRGDSAPAHLNPHLPAIAGTFGIVEVSRPGMARELRTECTRMASARGLGESASPGVRARL